MANRSLFMKQESDKLTSDLIT